MRKAYRNLTQCQRIEDFMEVVFLSGNVRIFFFSLISIRFLTERGGENFQVGILLPSILLAVSCLRMHRPGKR